MSTTKSDIRRWQSHGLKCLAAINKMGIPVGYVGVSESHPDYAKTYHEIEGEIEVHGGLTFSEMWPDEKDGLWYFGFDCGHAWDIDMSIRDYIENRNTPRGPIFASNKNIEYVQQECERLAEQLAKRARYKDGNE
jgi:hypothetical protein